MCSICPTFYFDCCFISPFICLSLAIRCLFWFSYNMSLLAFSFLLKPYKSTSLKVLSRYCQNYRLAEIGRFVTPKSEGKYETGQFFLHRVFGYRGVTLFPWTAKVYDRDIRKKQTTQKLNDEHNEFKMNGVTPQPHTYYQVLIDQRDCPYVKAQTEAVTFLGNQDNTRALYAIPGLDYVSHDDIIPYASTESTPIQHQLFNKFLTFEPDKDPPFAPRETLLAWQEKNHPWLELSDVHRETTENIRVTVIPFYMGCRLSQNNNVYWWRYCVRIENLADATVQLRERHWQIYSIPGILESIRGRGVVGEEPILSKAYPAFQYSSHVSLQDPSGHMWGIFKMEREDGTVFDCKIPAFALDSKQNSKPLGGEDEK